jgi:hypothetical protein
MTKEEEIYKYEVVHSKNDYKLLCEKYGMIHRIRYYGNSKNSEQFPYVAIVAKNGYYFPNKP